MKMSHCKHHSSTSAAPPIKPHSSFMAEQRQTQACTEEEASSSRDRKSSYLMKKTAMMSQWLLLRLYTIQTRKHEHGLSRCLSGQKCNDLFNFFIFSFFYPPGSLVAAGLNKGPGLCALDVFGGFPEQTELCG